MFGLRFMALLVTKELLEFLRSVVREFVNASSVGGCVVTVDGMDMCEVLFEL
jgi:hypothetical protein